MSLIRELASHPEYVALLKAAKAQRPELPPFNPNEDNTEQWKHVSGMQQGFDLCMAFFLPK